MALEISGKIIKVLPEQNGTGRNGAWKKQDFIVETKEQYPKKICITAWGDKVNALSQIPMQSDVKVNVNIESREFNDKWYTDVRAWKIETDNTHNFNDEHKDVTYTDTSYDDMTGVTFSDEKNNDDLPF